MCMVCECVCGGGGVCVGGGGVRGGGCGVCVVAQAGSNSNVANRKQTNA